MPTIIKLLFVCLFCTQACMRAQETSSETSGFELTGSFTTISDSVTILMINKETDETDSTYIINGEFKFNGQVERPTPFNIQGINYKEKKLLIYEDIFVENSIITIEQKDGKTQVRGSKSNDEKGAYYQGLRNVRNKYEVLLEKEELDQQDSLQLEKYIKEINVAKFDFYTKNPNSYFTVYQMMWETLDGTRRFNENLSKREVAEIFLHLSKEVKNSFYGKAIDKYISMPDMPEVGERYKDFALSSVNGGIVKLSDFEGKYVLVDFWAAWCSPCRRQNLHLSQLYEKYQSNGFEILGVSIDRDRNKWLNAIEEDNIVWTNVWGEGGWFSEVSQLYRINSIPDNILINPDGIIINRGVKVDKLAELLKTIFDKDDRNGI